MLTGMVGFSPVVYAEEDLANSEEVYFDLLADILEDSPAEKQTPVKLESAALKGLEKYIDSNQIVRYAALEMGKPYVYGAVGPESFDCSGLMVHIFSKAGKKIPRTSAQQAEKGVLVAREELRTGDLLFFDTRTDLASLKVEKEKTDKMEEEVKLALFDLPATSETIISEAKGYRPEKVTHVGIYVGEDKFIHAADPKTGVVLGSLSSKYFESRYLFAKRY